MPAAGDRRKHLVITVAKGASAVAFFMLVGTGILFGKRAAAAHEVEHMDQIFECFTVNVTGNRKRIRSATIVVFDKITAFVFYMAEIGPIQRFSGIGITSKCLNA